MDLIYLCKHGSATLNRTDCGENWFYQLAVPAEWGLINPGAGERGMFTNDWCIRKTGTATISCH